MLGTITYDGASRDEIALVEACHSNGFTLTSRSNKGITLDIQGEEQFLQELAVLEFSSDRKRMSVLVRAANNKIYCFTKGAENVMFDRMAKDEDLKKRLAQKLEEYARAGLRTLVVGYREVPEQEFAAWFKEWQAAQMASTDKEAKLMAAMEKMERNLKLLGVTAIEDCLQEEVPETIDYLLKCGIKIWVLTGDKRETAVMIGYTSRLLTDKTKVVHITSTDPIECKKQLEDCINLAQSDPDVAMVLDTSSLQTSFRACMNELVEAAKHCKSAICCRVTPGQKADVVRLIQKKFGKISLAIGDGANDVSMIRQGF